MKKIMILGAFLFIVSNLIAKNVVDSEGDVTTYVVKNPNDFDITDGPVVISVANQMYNSALVLYEKDEIPSQFDILDNGATRELSFVLDLKAGQYKLIKIIFSKNAFSEFRYKPRVNAQMFLRDGSNNIPMDVISSDADNMYNKVQHHGPAFESELAAYRIYFDQKQTIDLYGKEVKRLELAETMWYPSDEQLKNNYGDDILFVGNSVGLGTLKGWDGESTQNIKDMQLREMRIVAKGPVRAIVDVNVKGWKYNDNTIDLHSRYIIYAGHRDVQVSHTLSNNAQGMQFATGIQKLRRGDEMRTDTSGTVADWGRDFPVNDTIKYPQQTVGLAINIPSKYVVSEATTALSYIYIVKPDADNKINYRITMAAEKETFGYKSANQFFDYVATWREEKPFSVVLRSKLK